MNRLMPRIRRFIRKHPWVFITGLLAVFFLLSTFILYQAEKVHDPGLSFLEAIRIVLVFVLGEYGDTPVTTIGKIISVLLFITGIVIVATLIGKIASVFVSLKMEVKMPKNVDDHIIMCN